MSDKKARPGIVSPPFRNAIAGLLALAVAMGIGRFAFTPVLPMMLEEGALSIAQGSLLASANYAGYLAGAVLAMMVRLAPETAVRAGLTGVAATTLAMGLHLPFTAWLAMRFLAGIASAWVLISVSAWSVDALARHRRPVLGSIVFAGVGAGIAAAGLICLLLSAWHAASSHAWLALGLLSVLAAGFVPRFFRRPQVVQREAGSGGRYGWDGESIRMVICYGVFGFGYIIPATFLPVMARNALQDPGLFGWSWPLFGAAAALSTLSAALLEKYLDSRRIWIACHLVMAVGVALPALRPGLAAVFAAALLVGGTFMVLTLAAMQEAKRVAQSRAPVLIAAMTSAFAVGQILGPLSVAGGLGRDGDFSPALLAAAALLALSALALRQRPGMPKCEAGMSARQ